MGNVTMPLKGKGIDKTAQRRRAQDALRSVGLDGMDDRFPWILSGGMQQRAALARAIAYQPDCLLMDEPFASVDAQTKFDLEDLILMIRRESAKLRTHVLELVRDSTSGRGEHRV